MAVMKARALALAALALMAVCAAAQGPGAGTFPSDCASMAALSDDALQRVYAQLASSTTHTPPAGCFRGCVLPGHGSSLGAPLMQLGGLWNGKCFGTSGALTNFASSGAPQMTGTIRGSYAMGSSLSSSAGPAVLIRYPADDVLEDVGTALVTGGFAGTGAARLADMLDEVRGPMADGVTWLGATFVNSTAGDGQLVPHAALWFALRQM